MKLVVSYTHGDGYTYSCDADVPVEYESAEALLCDLEQEVLKQEYGYFTLWHGLCLKHFYYDGRFDAPEIYTLEEWFATKASR